MIAKLHASEDGLCGKHCPLKGHGRAEALFNDRKIMNG
jgi:hypothetical protein